MRRNFAVLQSPTNLVSPTWLLDAGHDRHKIPASALAMVTRRVCTCDNKLCSITLFLESFELEWEIQQISHNFKQGQCLLRLAQTLDGFDDEIGD